MKKLQDRLLDIGLDVFMIVFLTIGIAMIPGLLWLISGIALEIVKFIDDIVIKFSKVVFSIGYWYYVVCDILGTPIKRGKLFFYSITIIATPLESASLGT